MKRFLFSILLILLFSLPVQATIIDANLVGWWPMDDAVDGNTPCLDKSGNDNTGTLHGNTVYTVIGSKFGSALSFDGSGDSVNCGTLNDAIFTENGILTAGAWIKPNSSGEDNAYILFRGETTGGVIFRMYTSQIEFKVSGSTTLIRTSVTNSITLGIWQHVLVTWNGSTTAANIHLYVNGSEVSYFITTNGATLKDNSTANLIIGNSTVFSRSFDGLIDNILIYNRVLTASEIKLLYLGHTLSSN